MGRKINFRRWSDVILLGVVSYALVYLIASISTVQTAFGKWVSLFSSLPMAVQILLALTGFYCTRHLLLFFNVIHKRQLKNIQLCLMYPPITFSIVLCLLLFLPQFDIAGFFGDTFFASYLLVSALLFIILLSLLCAFDSLYSEKRKDKHEQILVPDWIKKEEQKNHYRWLMSERPLGEYDKDMLGREVYVDRIVRLFEPVDSKPRSKANHIAIVGSFGIGKTSLWRSVENKLGEDFVFVPVDGWGREEGTVAAQIIDEMVATLSTYVDCASIRNVPKEYMAALSGADFKGVSTLAKILPLHSHQSPDGLIKKIETILLSIGKTMVVVLEDFDRNPQGEMIMNEVAGLLDRLRGLKTINFIVCLAPGVQSHVLSRISTYREDLLSFNAVEMVKLTTQLMISDAENRSVLLFTDDRDGELFAVAMSSVIKTPREAKFALRRAYRAWEALAGEVNIYDLLAVNVLRYSAPEAFDFMVQHFYDLSKGVVNVEAYVKSSEGGSELLPRSESLSDSGQVSAIDRITGRDEVVANFIGLFASASVPEKNARKLIKMLFPYWHSIDGDVHGGHILRVSGEQGDVYLERILKESIADEHMTYSDIEFLKSFNSSECIDEDSFIEKLVGSTYWTIKYIGKIIHWVPINGYNLHYGYAPADVVDKFVKFLVYRFKSGKDIFCNEIYGSESRLSIFIERIDVEAKTGTVFSRFLSEIQDEPGRLYAAIKRSDEYAEKVSSYRSQRQLWIDHKYELVEYFELSPSLASQRKTEIIQFLNGLQ